MGRGADLPSLQCVDAPRAPASPSLAGACTVRSAGPHPAGRLALAPPHLSPLWAGRTPASLPAGAPVLASHLSSVAFSLEQPRPSPECALPRLSPRPGSEPAGLLQGVRGRVPLTHVLLASGNWVPLPGPHSTAQRGRGRRSQAPAAFCSAWDGRDPAALLGESGWANRAWGRPLPGDPRSPVCRLPRSASRARWERQAIPGGVPANRFFCLQPEVGPMALQGSRPPGLPRNPGRFQSVPRSRASVPPAASSL